MDRLIVPKTKNNAILEYIKRYFTKLCRNLLRDCGE